ncbi:hypothetical protein BKA62DRAFT_141451 [Auriculariales sp. MPI-PUGE-AT-0066]|nr:hypothetical protein BKA62DRAFT_141451 [Auriculariales sp. MPI-PUGE-AT-0066]
MSPRHRIGQHLHERPIAGPSRARQAPQDLNDIGIIDLTLSSDDEDIVPLRLNRRKLSEWRVDSESLSDQGFLPTPQRRFQYHIDIDEEVPDQPPVFNPPPPKPPQPELAPLPDGSLDPLAPDAAPADDPAEPVNPLARVLELVPDVDVNHAQQLLNEFLTAAGMDAAIENTLNRLFEDPSYPKAEKAKKRKRDEFEEQPRPQAPSKVDSLMHIHVVLS